VGRLPALALLLLVVTGCDGDKKPQPTATGQRSQAVQATGAATAATPAPVAATQVPSAKKPARKLCAGELEKPAREFPDGVLSRAAAPGARAVPEKLAPSGRWTWVNFWAAWCVPCKEEMPRLLGWEKKLSQAGKAFRVVFVSLDDDARQLDEFLQKQPDTGVRSSYWLKEGDERTDWLKAAEIEEDPELPTHLLVGPDGKVRCRVKGAVEDSDYASLAAIVGR